MKAKLFVQGGSQVAGLVAVSLAAVTWSLGSVGASFAFERGITPYQVGASRVWLTAAGLAVVVAVRRPPRKVAARVAPLHMFGFGLALALVAVSVMLAIGRLGVAIGTVLHYMAPVMVVLYGVVARRRWPPAGISFAVGFSIVGVVLVANPFGALVDGIDAVGILIGLFSAAMFASYTLLASGVLRIYEPRRALLIGFSIASVFWAFAAALTGLPTAMLESNVLPYLLWVGIVGTLIPFLLYVWGIQRVKAERAAVAATLEPAFAGVVAWVLLGQALSVWQIVGSAVILAAVISLHWQGSSERVIHSGSDGGS